MITKLIHHSNRRPVPVVPASAALGHPPGRSRAGLRANHSLTCSIQDICRLPVQIPFRWLASLALLCLSMAPVASANLPDLRIWGNVQLNGQYYLNDTLFNLPGVPEKFLMNGYGDINMSYRNFRMGFRYESYQHALLGYDPRYRGNGIPYRYASFVNKRLEVTLGSFYEQFGSGMTLRSYEERNLGIDNALDGFRLVLRPIDGITIRGLIGQQRFFFDKGPGIVRGFDTELNLNQLLSGLEDKPGRWIIGGSLVNKYQQDQNPLFRLPENVSALGGRIGYVRGPLNIGAEYAYKINDPSADNNFIYKEGQALFVTGSYAARGLGLLLSARHIDNMGFRSDRNATGNDLHINFLPPVTRQHRYILTGMYPYATQVSGETGFQGEVSMRIPRETRLGGPFGTTVMFNASLVKPVRKLPVHDTIPIGRQGTIGYRSSLFSTGNDTYFRDINLEITRRFTRSLSGLFSTALIAYNQNVVEGYVDREMVHAFVAVADMTLRLPGRKALRWELQHLSTQQDNGNWAMAMVEYHIAPKWIFSAGDQYNYGNSDIDMRLHYYQVGVAYSANASSIRLSFGKQREGVVCAGGVCRRVPASYGLAVSVSSHF